MRLDFLHPKFWITWVGLGGHALPWNCCPSPRQRRVGSAIGCLLRHLAAAAICGSRDAISTCACRNLSAAERAALVDRHCRSLGMALCETANTWWSSDKRVNKLADVQGLHHLAGGAGQGPRRHSGRSATSRPSKSPRAYWARSCRSMSCFGPLKNALLSHIMFNSFCRHGNPIPKDDIRSHDAGAEKE